MEKASRSKDDLSLRQLKAMKLAALVARKVQEEFPEVEKMYREGKNIPAISEEIDVSVRYNVNERVAYNSIYIALVGHPQIKNLDSLNGLLDEEERKKLGKAHQRERGLIRIKEFTKEQRKTWGKKGGDRVFEDKKGIFALEKEELSNNGKKAALKLGRRPYCEELKTTHHGDFNERNYICFLKEELNLSWQEVATETNKVFDNNRNVGLRTDYSHRLKN